MKRLLRKIEAAMAAAAFAEEGEADTARWIMSDALEGETSGPQPSRVDLRSRLPRAPVAGRSRA